MPLALALGGLGRDALKVAAGLGLLLLLALALLLTLLASLLRPVASATPFTGAPTPAAGNHFTPLPLGDTRWGSGANTFCELYVEQRFGLGNQGATAFAAYQRLAGLGLVHAGPPPPDALVYFGPSPDNEWDGHVGVADGNGLFTSITFYGLQQEPLAGWQAPYLGWVWPGDIHSDRFGAAVTPRS
jgi:hypothetical protein